MTGIRTLLTIGIAAVLLAAAPSARAANLEALSDTDAQLYAVAFQAAERGDFATVDASLARVSDPCLVGRLQYLKLTQPAAHSASYTDLVGWLKSFKDLPGADRIYALAVKLKPAGDEPPAPSAASVAAAGDAERTHASPQYRPAREAYFDGDLNRALTLARGSGDVWIAGLASYRLQSFPQALSFFEAVARNTGENDWTRAGGAFWAARAAEALGQGDRAQDFLRLAASLPDTFYGMVAARRLSLTDDPLGRVIDAANRSNGATSMRPIKINANGLKSPGVMHLVDSDPRARRAIALMQIGRAMDAGLELRTGLAMAHGDDERSAWATLVYALNPDHLGSMPVQSAGPGLQGVVYPMPTLAPVGGFTINRSLVYAVSWQESRFDQFAVSPVGAMGIMQVMPATVASIAGDDNLRHDPMPLFDGPTNLRLGQQYMSYLMDRAAGNDILKAVAAYNGGPGVVSRAQAIVGPDADSLTLLESLPFYETRAYVQKVMAAYWSYQRQFGGQTRTLDAVASGGSFIDARLDH